MSEQSPRMAYHRRTADRWQDWLDSAGTRCAERRVVNYGRTEADAGEAPPQLSVREVFARAHPDERRALDLLLVVLVEHGSRSGSRPPAGELVVFGPETIRAQTTAGVAGLTVNELRVGPVMPELRSVSLALVRITRGGRSQDVVSSIEQLGRLLDNERDPDGSAAVAHAIVRRLEVLTSGPGVTVSVAGAVSRPGDGSGPEAMHLLTDADAPLTLDDDVELRDGRLMTVGRGRRPVAWRGGDYVIVRAGRPVARRAEVVRSLAQLRREHALAEVSLGSETERRGDTYSSRAASVRQSLRAEQIVRHATVGDSDGAVEVLRVALTQPGARGPLVESVAGGLVSVRDYWSVLPAVRRAEDDAGTTPEARSIAEVMRERLGQRLDQILALSTNESTDSFIPVVTPIVLEVSDALVPIVDSRQDSGYFLHDLVPAMQDRGRDGTGVRIPGVRARGNPGLAPGEFSIQIDEVPVVTARMLIEGAYAVRSLGTRAVGSDVEVAETHPLTGEWGRWGIHPLVDGQDEVGERLRPAQYLVHRIERVVRANLHRCLGIQEVDALLTTWRIEDAEFVDRAVPSPRAATRLTLVLQDLVAERVPITDWRAILGAISDARGLESDLRTLRRTVRARLRDQLPGPRSGPLLRRVPGAAQAALLGVLAGPRAVPAERARLEFLRWLRREVVETGPGIALVARDTETRELVAALARAERDVVTTLTEEEVTSA